MEITIEKLKEILKFLPSANQYGRDEYRVAVLANPIIITEQSIAPPSSINSRQELIFRKVRGDEGYTWALEL